MEYREKVRFDLGRIRKYLMKAVTCGPSDAADCHKRIARQTKSGTLVLEFNSAPAEQRVPQTSGMGALHKLEFAAAFGHHPDTLFHIVGSKAVTRPVRFRQIYKGTLRGNERLELVEYLVSQMRSKSGCDSFDIVQIPATRFSDDDRGKLFAVGHIASDHKFALEVKAMFLPGIGYFAGKIHRILTFGDNALQSQSPDLFHFRLSMLATAMEARLPCDRQSPALGQETV